jgi:hypothetical protein
MNDPNFKFTNVADRATGYFGPDSWPDYLRMKNTMEWCYQYCKGKWRRSIYATQGRIVFEFESTTDADNLRRVSARTPVLLPCR